MKRQKDKLSWRSLLRECVKSPHRLLITCGLLVGLIYSPFWLYDVVIGTLNGAASLLMVATTAFGLYLLWNQHQSLAKLQAMAEDRWLGHLIIVGGIGLAPFCFFAEWSQKLVWILILVGITCSTWGVQFFKQYTVPAILVAIGFFPQPTVFGKLVWDAFLPPAALERFMAWSGGLGLQGIGQSATVTDTIISLPAGAVRVDWGCSGFDMASIVAVTGLLLGFFFKQSLPKVMLIVGLGAVLALLSNIPRIMLMAMAEAYWGKGWFEFWHGFWGGQIFSTLMMTIYYYMLMAIVHRRSNDSLKQGKANEL